MSTPDPSPPPALPGLQMLRRLGVGGMAEVWLARQEALDRKVAVKFMDARFVGDQHFVSRFLREAQALAVLQHPHVVGVYDRGEVEGRPFYVMQYISGSNLRDLLKQSGGRLPQGRALEYLDQVLSALEYIHSKGIVHRDLKPENVLVDEHDQAQLADFGLASVASVRERESKLTATNMAMGTLHYMSPEQSRDAARVDARTDIYATGVMLYEMLTGAYPVGTWRPIHKVVPGASAGLGPVVQRCLAYEPSDRYEDAGQLRADLGKVLRGEIPELAMAHIDNVRGHEVVGTYRERDKIYEALPSGLDFDPDVDEGGEAPAISAADFENRPTMIERAGNTASHETVIEPATVLEPKPPPKPAPGPSLPPMPAVPATPGPSLPPMPAVPAAPGPSLPPMPALAPQPGTVPVPEAPPDGPKPPPLNLSLPPMPTNPTPYPPAPPTPIPYVPDPPPPTPLGPDPVLHPLPPGPPAPKGPPPEVPTMPVPPTPAPGEAPPGAGDEPGNWMPIAAAVLVVAGLGYVATRPATPAPAPPPPTPVASAPTAPAPAPAPSLPPIDPDSDPFAVAPAPTQVSTGLDPQDPQAVKAALFSDDPGEVRKALDLETYGRFDLPVRGLEAALRRTGSGTIAEMIVAHLGEQPASDDVHGALARHVQAGGLAARAAADILDRRGVSYSSAP